MSDGSINGITPTTFGIGAGLLTYGLSTPKGIEFLFGKGFETKLAAYHVAKAEVKILEDGAYRVVESFARANPRIDAFEAKKKEIYAEAEQKIKNIWKNVDIKRSSVEHYKQFMKLKPTIYVLSAIVALFGIGQVISSVVNRVADTQK